MGARARVMLAEPVGLLDYSIPAELEGAIRPGIAVRAPLGKRVTSGYVAAVEEGPGPAGITLRPLHELDRDRPPLPTKLVELILFAASYYQALPGEVLEAALPASARTPTARFRLTDAGKSAAQAHSPSSAAAVLEIAARFPRGFTALVLERELGWPRRRATRVLSELTTQGLVERLGRGRKRRKRGAEEVDAPHREAASALGPRSPVARFVPTQGQAAALEQLEAAASTGRFKAFLLEGVTGSGKTEVYLRLIEGALARGRSALVLVPEIALTPQLGARFRDRFGAGVETFHSGLTIAERRDAWERIARGEARIALGARSALFVPLENLGVIVIDEEHETSFKQEDSPRYNARDLAIVRARDEGAVVVLGSATPSIETRMNADQGRYTRLQLPARATGGRLPESRVLDLAVEPMVGEGILTATLADALDTTLRAGDQAILFLNRRGYASYVYCRDCGHSFRCAECDIALTLHKRRAVLACHHCGHEEEAPDECPACHGPKVDVFGLGTERIEHELRALYGDVPLARLDRDTVKKRSDLETTLERFARGEARILVGTQMVAKGHDFPNVTLVGVIAADAGLNFPDFRAAERTFQLLTQVAGRAGRGAKPGHVLVQAYATDHYAVRAALAHDYERYYREELQHRRELGYPPFVYLALLRFEGSSESTTRAAALAEAEALRDAAKAAGARLEVLGPAMAPLARLRGRWRVQLLVKAASRAALSQLLRALPTRRHADIRRILDIDPYSVL